LEAALQAARQCGASTRNHSPEAPLTGGAFRLPLRRDKVQSPVLEHRFRIWASAATNATVRSQVLMDQRDATAGSIEVADELAFSAMRFAGRASARVRARKNVLRELAALSSLPELLRVEEPAELVCGYDYRGR
jgi:uncharacterized protein YfiM (DUF2279 family)